jgi:hypothetical protein
MPTGYVRSVILEGVEPGSQYYSPDPDPMAMNPNDCVSGVCTGLANDVLVDMDGTLFGLGANTAAIANNAAAVSNEARASLDVTQNVYLVPNSQYRYTLAFRLCCFSHSF